MIMKRSLPFKFVICFYYSINFFDENVLNPRMISDNEYDLSIGEGL